ncbi:MAG: type II toxin-antitoxin system prevent-host-death family antitoxin [Chloroflexi bacterium]|nr:type II toxin-antitoxin system prevent-host-death family antitoxin [Chloroflexota bacterium]
MAIVKESSLGYTAEIERVKATGEPLVIEGDGKPLLVVLPYAEYDALVKQKLQEQRKAYMDVFERERAAFEKLKPQLLETHLGQYVAIHDGQVVDSGTSDTELAQRVLPRFRNQAVYIQLVQKELPVYEITSREELTRA